MRIDILTLFPSMFTCLTGESIIARAVSDGLVDIRLHQIRDFTENRQNQVDDYPYGGGRGCVMQTQPLYSGWEYIKNQQTGSCRTIYLSPQGKVFTQGDAIRLGQDYDNLILVCGHYEGIDQRFIDACVDEEISLGDFVLTGGEIPAMAVADSVCRLLPGVLSDSECFTDESHWNGLLEYPQYSRPEIWQGKSVPPVLLSGDHGQVEKFRRKESLRRTLLARPDMFEKMIFSKSDLKLLSQIKDDNLPPHAMALLNNIHTDRITVRKSTENDLPRVQKLLNEINSEKVNITLDKLHSQGTHYSIYAEGLGFCGQAGYHMIGNEAELFIYLLPHSRGKGIGGYSLKTIISEPLIGVNRFTLPSTETENGIWRRLSFSFPLGDRPTLEITHSSMGGY